MKGACSLFLFILFVFHDVFPEINADLQVAIWKRDKRIDGYYFGSDVVLRTTGHGSIECAVECLKVKSCRSVTFHSNTRKCLGYSKMFENITDGVYSSSTKYLGAQSACGGYKFINKTIATENGLSEVNYKCDYGYKQSGQITSTICLPNGKWSQVNINCADCNIYGSTFKKRENRYFQPPYSHVPSYMSEYDTVQEALNAAKTYCVSEAAFVCRSFYFHRNFSTTNKYYYVLWPMRVYDDITYKNYYKESPDFDEYVRDCF